MTRFEYLGILLFWLILAGAIHYYYRLPVFRNVRQAAVTMGFFFIVGIAWDLIGIYRDHWFFQYENLLGITIGRLPIEEMLFVLIVPYFVLVFYNLFRLKID